MASNLLNTNITKTLKDKGGCTEPDPHIAGVTHVMFVLKEKKKGASDEGERKKGKSKWFA